jgi:hypothetical protein
MLDSFCKVVGVFVIDGLIAGEYIYVFMSVKIIIARVNGSYFQRINTQIRASCTGSDIGTVFYQLDGHTQSYNP